MNPMMKWLIALSTAVGVTVGKAWCGEMAYVIKVTPSLVYLDAGERTGVQEGDAYLILSQQEEHYSKVGEVKVIRVFEEFCIAEISFLEKGKEIELLQRAVPRSEWEETAMSLPPVEESPAEEDGERRRRFVFLLAGMDWGKDSDLEWNGERLIGVKSGDGWSMSVRMGKALSDRWLMNFTYRIGRGGDVTQLGLEGDFHFLFRGIDGAGLYLGAGAGLHYLTWDARGNNEESTNKAGMNLMAGLRFPGRWTLLIEGGYQRVLRWGDLIDVSNLRTYVGMGRSF